MGSSMSPVKERNNLIANRILMMEDTNPTVSVTDPSDSTPSSIDVISTVGTWVAAVLAIIALVGIVGPFLAIRAATSDKNRALNAVWDQEQRYVTKGLRIGKATIFRRVNIPNLAPAYDTNTTQVPKIAGSLGSSGELLRFEFPEHKKWNSGWAMLVATIESYQADGAPSRLVSLGGGHWEVINSLSAIVVSQYWILFLGLLGRYTDKDRNKARETDMDVSDAATDESDSNATQLVMPRTYKTADPGRRRSLLRVTRGRHGMLELSKAEPPTIYGFTGRFRSLGRQRGKWADHTTLVFYGRSPQVGRDILHDTEKSTRETEIIPIRFHFWLAYGFIPIGTSTRYDVLSMLDPIEVEKWSAGGKEVLTKPGFSRRNMTQQMFALQRRKVWQEIRNGATALNETSWTASRWVPVSPSPENDTRAWYNVPHPDSPRFDLHDVSKVLRAFFSLDWHHWGYLTPADECDYWSHIFYSAARLLGVGRYSWLYRRGRLLPHYMNAWVDLVPHVLAFIDNLQCDPSWTRILKAVFDWNPEAGYHPVKTKEYVQFVTATNCLIPASLEWAKVPLSELFITITAFRESVYTLLRPLEPEPPATDAEITALATATEISSSSNIPQTISASSILGPASISRPSSTSFSESAQVADSRGPVDVGSVEGASRSEVHSEGPGASVLGAESAGDHAKRSKTRGVVDKNKIQNLVRKRLMAEKLEEKVRKGVARQKRLAEKKKSNLEHQKRLETKRNELKQGLERKLGITNGRGVCRNFTFTVVGTALTLRWEHQALKVETTEDGWPFSTWDGEAVQEEASTTLLLTPVGEQEGSIPDRDVVLIALWAAAKCVLWMDSDSSAPLIKFVNRLDRDVFVM